MTIQKEQGAEVQGVTDFRGLDEVGEGKEEGNVDTICTDIVDEGEE
jgi:hypothetical protein